jgi:two-component system chemotaxis response regulator CheB
MPGHDLIVLGASAGGVEALSQLVSELPANLPAALCAVVHIPATNLSVLPKILSRHGPLPAHHPRDGQPLLKGHIYVAPPDRHLLIQEHFLHLGQGPRENGHRPAVDPLFRSAAWAFGPRVVGVVLSGMLDDGTAGLLAIKRRGGVAIVQDPEDAVAPGMPRNAIENMAADHVLPVVDIAALLVRLAREPAREEGTRLMSREMEEESKIAEFDMKALKSTERNGPPSEFACPECGGALFELREGQLVRYRCRVGHAFSPESLAAQQAWAIDEALWTAFRALEERAALARDLAERMTERGFPHLAHAHEQQARDAEGHAQLLRQVLLENGGSLTPPEMDAAPTPDEGREDVQPKA